MKEIKVIRTSLSTVVPAESLPTSTAYFLSNFDQFFASTGLYMEAAYYFRKNESCQNPLPSLQSLKNSLSQVLSLYPVFAGRVKKADSCSGRLEVEMNGKGVPFEEAEAEASLSEWPDLYDCDLVKELVPQNPFCIDIFKAPLIRVQFTKFKCGGMVLGFNSHHLISDGQATMEFLRTWGEIHRGIKPTISPKFDSIKIRARNPTSVSIHSADNELLACIPVPIQIPSIPPEVFKNVHFRMEGDMLMKCREDVQNGPFSYGSASSFEALSALMWTVITRARKLEETARTAFVFPVSVRERWRPPLSAGYFGNAVFMHHAAATAEDLQSKHFSFAASLIHKKVTMVDSEFAQSVVDWMETRLQEQKPIGVGFNVGASTDLINTSFTHFPVYEINFGQKLDHFEFIIPSTTAADGMIYILPSPPCTGKQCRDIKLRLREDHLENMLHDPDFELYFPKSAVLLTGDNY